MSPGGGWQHASVRCRLSGNLLDRRQVLNPSNGTAPLRVFLYLQKHPDESLTLGGRGPNAEVLQIVTDASHEEGPSISGVLIIMGSALLHWICRRQSPRLGPVLNLRL